MHNSDDPLKRAQEVIDSMWPSQRAKFDEVVSELRIEWAVAHGTVNSIILDALCKRAALDTDVSAIIVGAQPFNSLQQVAKNIGETEPFLQASLDARDAELKRQLEQEVYDETSPQTKMAMGHSGTWDAHLSEQVAQKMDARTSARF